MRLLMHWSTATAQKKRKIQKKTWKRNRHDDNHAEMMPTYYKIQDRVSFPIPQCTAGRLRNILFMSCLLVADAFALWAANQTVRAHTSHATCRPFAVCKSRALLP